MVHLAKEIASGKRGKLEVALGTCHKRRLHWFKMQEPAKNSILMFGPDLLSKRTFMKTWFITTGTGLELWKRRHRKPGRSPMDIAGG